MSVVFHSSSFTSWNFLFTIQVYKLTVVHEGADARKTQWSAGDFHLLVRHFLSRVPLYVSLAKIQTACCKR